MYLVAHSWLFFDAKSGGRWRCSIPGVPFAISSHPTICFFACIGGAGQVSQCVVLPLRPRVSHHAQCHDLSREGPARFNRSEY